MIVLSQNSPALARALATTSSTTSSSEHGSSSRWNSAAALGGALTGLLGASVVASANEVGDGLHAPHYPWPHEGPLDSYDHGSIRRGHQVYQQVRCNAHARSVAAFTPAASLPWLCSAMDASRDASGCACAPPMGLACRTCRCVLRATAWSTSIGGSWWVWRTLRRRQRRWQQSARCAERSSSLRGGVFWTN